MHRATCFVALTLVGVVPAQLTWSDLATSPFASRPGEGLQGPFGFYDPQRGRVTLVGGQSMNGPFSKPLLQYEGLHSVPLTTAAPFPLRSFGATAVDENGTVILYGGLNADLTHSDETWKWDPTLPGTVNIPGLGARPSPRSRTAMALDRTSGAVVLFGGADGAGDREDTWLWKHGAWSQVFPPASPPKRSAHAMAYDPQSRRVVLFGGTSGGTLMADTWFFDGVTWVQGAGAGPSARKGHTMALDEVRREVVLVGGELASTASSETWALRPGGWNFRAGTLPNNLNAADGTLVFDPRRQQLVHIGGRYHTPFGWTPGRFMRAWDGAVWTSVEMDARSPVAEPYPPERWDAMVAFDEDRDRIVVFGGRLLATNSIVAETWECGDGLWAQRAPAQSPSARRFGAMTWGEGKTWLFGGENALGTLATNDLWRWDGRSWTLAPTSATRPPVRTYASMAFDPMRKRVVLYGGLDPNSASLADVWEYDVTTATWAPGAGTPPSARYAPALCWDPVHATMLLHGGQLPGTTVSRETWRYDGQTWSLRANTGPALQEHSMAYDAQRNRLVVAGGLSNPQETWEFDGVTWQSFGQGAIVHPKLVHDSLRRRCVAVTLIVNWPFSVCSWNGSQWSHAVAAPSLGVRTGHTLTVDPLRRVEVLIGGSDASVVTGDWWDGKGPEWRRTLPTHALPPRRDHAAAWLPGENKVLVFGGRHANGSLLGDTWLLDAANQDWLQVAGSAPAPRAGHTLCTEESTGRILLFGGSDGSPREDTWTFTRGAGWTPLVTTTRPEARSGHAMTFYPPTGTFFLFGGSGFQGVLGDLWQLQPTGSGWSRVVTAHAPPARQDHVLAYDRARARLVLHGGLDANRVPLADVWEFDGRDWSERKPESTAQAIAGHQAHFDEDRGRVVFSSGVDRSTLWSNVDPAGIGDPLVPMPLQYRTQPVVGDLFRVAFPVNGTGLLYVAPGPVTTPRLVLRPPLACRNLDIFVDLRLYVPTLTPEVAFAIPPDAALIGARLTLQAITKGGPSCLTATDALHVELLARR